MAKRVIWIVLDSAGVGEAPDAARFGDAGADTFGHILREYPDAKFHNLTELGLKAIEQTSFYEEASKKDIIGCYGKAQECSDGKDTTTG
ncbi:MAG: phosphopentomutase, partial [Wujia sp.]